MINPPDVVTAEFLQYNCWANLHLIDACRDLTPEQLASSVPGVYGNIYDTFKHIVRSEAEYYRKLTGVRLDPPFDWDTHPPLSEIRSYFERVGRSLVEAAGQTQMTDTLERDWKGPEWESYSLRFKAVAMLIQAVNHGVEHRTNITTILAQQGVQTPQLDGWEYIRLNPDRLGT